MGRKIYCTNCGRKNSVESNFCLFCGSKLVKPATGQIEMAQTTPAQNSTQKSYYNHIVHYFVSADRGVTDDLCEQ